MSAADDRAREQALRNRGVILCERSGRLTEADLDAVEEFADWLAARKQPAGPDTESQSTPD